MKKLELCKDCGNEASFYQGWPGRQWLVFCTAQGCKNETKFYRNKKKARKAWNNQQRQAKPREWKDEITKTISLLYRTVGRQIWLDCLEEKDIIEIRDNIIPVFQKHLEMRKLVVQPKTELQKVKADNAQQLVELCKLRIENGQLRQQVQQLEATPDKPLVDFDKVLLENEQLREQERELARTLTKLAAALGKVE